jgi:hypothetical protein
VQRPGWEMVYVREPAEVVVKRRPKKTKRSSREFKKKVKMKDNAKATFRGY